MTTMEWEKEPNRMDWEYCGFKCLILRSPEMKHLCGYVGLPKWHPYYKKEYNDVDVEVHGGLTFSREGSGDKWEKDYWWIGFDCAHIGDLVPEMEKISRQLNFPKGYETYRNIDYVRNETERLVEQIKEGK